MKDPASKDLRSKKKKNATTETNISNNISASNTSNNSKSSKADKKNVATLLRNTKKQLLRYVKSFILNLKVELILKIKIFHFRAVSAKKSLKTELDQWRTIAKQCKKLDKTQQLLLNLILNSGKKAKGRRYSVHEKALAVVIYKQSPKCYRFLQQHLGLPGETTIKQFQNEFKMETGLHIV